MVIKLIKSVLAMVMAVCAACSYKSSFVDCEVACTESTGCPPGFTCSASEGLCRSGAMMPSCAAVLDGGDDSGGIDAKAIDAAPGMIAFDSKSSMFVGSGSSTITWQHTVGTSGNRLLLVGVSIEHLSGAIGSAVTFDSMPMTLQVRSVSPSSEPVKAELWYLKNPPAGPHPVVVTFTTSLSGDGAVGGSVSLFGVDQADPIPTSGSGGDNGSTVGTLSTPITTMYDHSWIIDVVTYDHGDTLTAGSAQMPQWNVKSMFVGAASALQDIAAGPHTMTWSSSGADHWAHVAVEVKP